MINHEVSILEPGIKDNGATAAWETQYAADIYIQPPVTIGAELARFIGGTAGGIIISEIASTDEGSHAMVACAQGRAAHSRGAQAVEQAIDRLRTYLNTEPSQLGTLHKSFADEPLFPAHGSRQM